MSILIRVRCDFLPVSYRRCIHRMRLTETINPKFHKKPLEPKAAAIIKEHSSDILHASYVESMKRPLTFAAKGDILRRIRREEIFPATHRYPSTVLAQFVDKNTVEDRPIKSSTFKTTDEDDMRENAVSSATVEDDDEDIARRDALAESRKQIMRELGFRASVIEDADTMSADNWMEDYETFNEADVSHDSQYGTPDPTEPMTEVQCHGCGSHLHCQDSSVPGYLPSEIIKGQPKHILKTMVCQRCHFLKHYNTSLKVNVDPEDYVTMLSKIDERALVILLADLTELPFSVWPDIVDVLGPKRPIFIVGNKIDLLPQDSTNYLEHIKNTLETTLIDAGITRANIKYISLISAKTRFGIEEMITNLHKFWWNKGDVYLVGNGNAGKSTLFNAMLESDYCKIRARDLVRRATASLWPGTTMRMLKFPIARPSAALIHNRNKRVRLQTYQTAELMRLSKYQLNTGRLPERTLMGHLGQTHGTPRESKSEAAVHLTDEPSIERTLNEHSKAFQSANWFYDTPGVIRKDQIITQLTNEELLYTIPHQALWPRVFYVQPGSTLFVSGLGRIDYTTGSTAVRLAVFASEQLSILITTTAKADELYEKCLGTEILNVPRGDAARLKEFPRLKRCEDKISVSNHFVTYKRSACDIVLSSAGWVSVNLPVGETAHFYAWTPNSKGMFVRKSSILPYAAELYRGKRIKFTAAYLQKEPSTVISESEHFSVDR